MYNKLFVKRYVQQSRVGVTSYIFYTDSVCISMTALYVWKDIYCFLSMKQFFHLTWKSQQLHKGISVIKAPINDQYVHEVQLTYLLAMQLTLCLDGQLILEKFGNF